MKNSLKSKFTVFLFVIMIACLCLGLYTIPARNASASEGFTMDKGASIRLDTPTGIRFSAAIGASYDENVDYGMLIVPYDYFAKAEVSISSEDYVNDFMTAYEEGKILKPIVTKNVTITQDDNDIYHISHSIAQIQQNNYRRQWFGVAFIDNGDGTYDYATSNDNVRSVVQVSGAALDDYYYNPEISQVLKDTYESNLDVMEAFVKTGIGQVVGNDFALAISGALNVVVGTPETLTTNLPESLNLEVNWSSSDETVATVNSGVVTFLKNGTVTITAKVNGIYEDTHVIEVVSEEDLLNEKLDNISERLVNETENPSHKFDQTLNTEDKENIYAGENSIKLTYNSAKTIADSYNIDNGGTAFTCENNKTTIYDAFTAYNENTQSYESTDANQSTYAGFWVKNTTNKELKVSLAIKIYDADKNSVWLCGSAFNEMGDVLTIAANDTEWNYYKVQLSNFISIGVDVKTHRIRMGLAVSVDGVADNDSFYIDNFDIFCDEKISENAAVTDNLAKTLVRSSGDRTLSVGYTQELNLNAANVKEGLNSIKATYTGTNPLGSSYNTFLTENGGSILGIYADNETYSGITSNGRENVNARKFVSAYTSDTFKSADSEKTYVGFWVKNTTGKTLQVGFTLRAWDSNEQEYLSGTNNRFHNYNLTIAANDTEWKYFEMDLTDYCVDTFGGPIIRMGLGAKIANAEVGDTFYVDSFDIYHGSRVN